MYNNDYLYNGSQYQTHNPMYQLPSQGYQPQTNASSDDERLIAGGFLAPFLLGGIAGAAIAPNLGWGYGRPTYYNTYYYPTPYYYRQYPGYYYR